MATPHQVTPTWWDHATLWNADDPYLSDAGHTTDGGRVFGITRTRYSECDGYGCKPVAVIDATTLERPIRGGDSNYTTSELARTLRLLAKHDAGGEYTYRAEIVRELADVIDAQLTPPPPPKPDEPTGRYAIAIADGVAWCRAAWANDRPWSRVGTDVYADWDDMDVTSIVSEGVTP